MKETIIGPAFAPAWEWKRRHLGAAGGESLRKVRTRLTRPDGTSFTDVLRINESDPEAAYLHFARHIKFLLWQKGGSALETDAPHPYLERIRRDYDEGPRQFDSRLIGESVFGHPLEFAHRERIEEPGEAASGSLIGGGTKGCRVGFDLGGSDRKSAAVMDGEVLFSEEVEWSPYFESDPDYHWEGIVDSIKRAASKLPRLDAIGGSAAGIYIDSEPRVGSLYRGVGEKDFRQRIQPLFHRLSEYFGGVPVHVVNDGDATALSAAQTRGLTGVLGIAMGTSMAVGYVDTRGSLQPWLNELAFAPVDYSPEAPVDEWSGDRGCGAQYFSQQAVVRLLPYTGLKVDGSLPAAEQLKAVQAAAEEGDGEALGIFRTIGTFLGYSILHYKDYYAFDNLLLLGRVLSGVGGDLLREGARETLASADPACAESLEFLQPTERERRHGQAIAAAGLVPDTDIKGS
ncbi:MAG: hypothetical protein R6V45_09860 [Oceanipulchritudo sp.]